MPYAILSGCPSPTDSEVKRKVPPLTPLVPLTCPTIFDYDDVLENKVQKLEMGYKIMEL